MSTTYDSFPKTDLGSSDSQIDDSGRQSGESTLASSAKTTTVESEGDSHDLSEEPPKTWSEWGKNVWTTVTTAFSKVPAETVNDPFGYQKNVDTLHAKEVCSISH